MKIKLKITALIFAAVASFQINAMPEALNNIDRNLSVFEKAKLVNDYYNQFTFSIEPIGVDEWKTPKEFLMDRSGDSEDFVIAKFFALSQLGLNKLQMSLAYVHMTGFNEPHMVLFLFDKTTSTRYVLDCLDDEIKDINDRDDLDFIYGFNDTHIWTKHGFSGDAQQIPKWMDLISKIKD